MYAEDCPYKVVRTNGSDEVLAGRDRRAVGRENEGEGGAVIDL
jgi:hypothetical protein